MDQSPAAAGTDYYIARPKTPNGGRVLVLHAWWGLNGFIKSFCDQLAGEGFTVLAPDLYHGALATTIGQAQTLVSRLEQDAAAQAAAAGDVVRAAEALQHLDGVRVDTIGVVGFRSAGPGRSGYQTAHKARSARQSRSTPAATPITRRAMRRTSSTSRRATTTSRPAKSRRFARA